jgi:hypothetical protein
MTDAADLVRHYLDGWRERDKSQIRELSPI